MALEFSESLVLGLKSNWRLRPEQHQAALYKHSLLELSWRIIPLTWALALGLMDGVRPLKVLIKELMGLLDIKNEEQARAVYRALIEFSNATEEPFLVEIKQTGQEITSVNLRKLLELYAAPASKPKVSRGRLEVPIQPLFMPTNLCQTNCVYCYAERPVNPPDSMLPLQRWIEIIDELAQLGIDMVGMSGGDPMLFPGGRFSIFMPYPQSQALIIGNSVFRSDSVITSPSLAAITLASVGRPSFTLILIG